ncbi:uncharacterized protein [Mytilus edulis]|uniref:uncharacterized protein n=1 Tax=Mytilus edulis TaxID=6550 RepID=UPI0039F0FD8A
MDTLWISAFLFLCIQYVHISMMQVAGLVTTIRYQEGNTVNISCLGTSKIRIQNISVQEEETTCLRKPCFLSSKDTQTIDDNCNGVNFCLVDYNFTSACLREFKYMNLSYTCKHENRTSVSTFEADLGDWMVNTSVTNTWTRTNLVVDHTRVRPEDISKGYSVFAISYSGTAATSRTDTDKKFMEPVCLSLWYQFYANAFDCYFNIYKISDRHETLLYTVNGSSSQQFFRWINISVDAYGQDPFKIALEADCKQRNSTVARAILIDDTSIAYRPCQGQQLETTCLDIEKPIKIQCETQLLVGNISLSLEPDNLIRQQNKCTGNSIESKLNTFCSNFNNSEQCEFNMLDFMHGYENCYVTNKHITIKYQCRDTPTTSMESSTASYVSVPLQTTSGTPFVKRTTQASIPIIVVSVLVVVIVAALVFIIIVFYRRRKIAKNSNSSENRQKEIKTDNIISYSNNSGMANINIPEIYENIHDNNTINCEEHQQEENYETLSTNRKSDEHMYASTEHESTEPNLSQYQSLTNPSESDIHTYASTERDLSQYTSLTNPVEPDIHTYASTASK